MLQMFQYIFHNLSINTLRNYTRSILNASITPCEKYTAGIIIIGDEILKAQEKDTNSYFMCSLLYECGVRVEKISVISDNVEQIANEIREFSEKYRYVITSGGVGPTHDDMTYEGLAKAFGDSLHYHPTLLSVVKELCKTDDKNSPLLKVASIPSNAILKFGKDNKTGEFLKFPCINVKNVYVFPGSPIYLEPLFSSLYKELFDAHKVFVKKVLYIDATEELYADALKSIANEYPHVAFGSYPVSNQRYYKARVTIESDDKNVTTCVLNKFCSLIPYNILVNYDDSSEIDSLKKYNELISNLEKSSYDISVFVNTLKELCDIYLEPNKVALWFDGSVESMILLHLSHVAKEVLNIDFSLYAIFFKYETNDIDREQFIKDISVRYNLHLITMNIVSIADLDNLKISLSQLQTLLIPTKSSLEEQYNLLRESRNIRPHMLIEIKYVLKAWTLEHLQAFSKSSSLPYYLL